jgi:hypothetical protein
MFLSFRHLRGLADRLHRALIDTQRAIDANCGVDDQEIRSDVEAVNRAYLDAVGVAAIDAGFGNDVGPVSLPQRAGLAD